jgi:hypothetical protein
MCEEELQLREMVQPPYLNENKSEPIRGNGFSHLYPVAKDQWIIATTKWGKEHKSDREVKGLEGNKIKLDYQ